MPAGQRAGRLAVVVDDRDGARDDPERARRRDARRPAIRRRVSSTMPGLADPPSFSSSASAAAKAVSLGLQVPTSSGTRGRGAGVRSPAARRQLEAPAGEARAVAGEQAAHDLPGLADRLERPAAVDPELGQPGARRQPQERPPVAGLVEQRHLPGELDGVDAVGVVAGRPDPHPARRPGDLEQPAERRPEPEVVEQRDDREPGLLDDPGVLAVGRQRQVGLQAEAELSAHVRSCGGQRAAADALDPHDQPLVRVGAADQAVLLEPVPGGQLALLGGQQRQHRLQRVEAEVAALGDPQLARLGELEVVADGHPADRAALDPLDRHPQVVQLGPVLAHGPSVRTASSSTSSRTPSGMKPAT